ncbi:MAG: ATP-binding protein [Vampirovibrionales bacterium]|nr:ATP-binding protein [Vampirovibrionales bacterium]
MNETIFEDVPQANPKEDLPKEDLEDALAKASLALSQERMQQFVPPLNPPLQAILSPSETLHRLQLLQPSLWRVIQEMHDSVLLCEPGPEGLRVLTVNQVLSQLLPHTVLLQLYYYPSLREVIDSEALYQLVSSVIEHRNSQGAELHLPLGRSHPFVAGPKPIGQYFQVLALPIHYQTDIPPAELANITPDAVMVMLNDTTAIRRTEKMRRDFVANVSHELRTPLSAIKGYAETLYEGAIEDEAVARDFTKVILRHAQRLTQLVEDLLDLSKLESPDFRPDLEPLALPGLLKRVFSLIVDKAEDKGIEMELEVPDELPLVVGDSSGLEQVLTNLLDNAIKYTPVNGNVRLSAEVQDRVIRVDVKDTGIGIDHKYIHRVFERFYRVDKARSRDMGGTGLGLSIVKHIVQLHGGDIWVESVLNEGSTFSFTLPIQVAPIQPKISGED